MTSTYTINPRNILKLHSRDRTRFLRDADMDECCERVHVKVKSGDLFIAMATELDDLSDQLEGVDEATYRQLQDIIDDLLHLQSQYAVIKKDSRYYSSILGNPGPINLS